MTEPDQAGHDPGAYGREIRPGGAGAAVAAAAGAGTLAFIDADSKQKRGYGHHKEGARFGHTKIGGKSLLVRGLKPAVSHDLGHRICPKNKFANMAMNSVGMLH